jgi:peroxiredoxin (alkyl hydroperoxide reductase subunit C)
MSLNLIGKTAPYFSANAVVNGQIHSEFSLRDFTGSYVVFFFYPLDFTFVCPTELHAFEEAVHEFEIRNCKIVACSVDSVYSHLAWMKTEKRQGGIEGISYPIVSDLNKQISKLYGVLKEDEGIAYRGLFLLDKQGMIRHMVLNDLSIGRSVDEVLRTLDALIFHENHGEVCPANWKAGEKAFKADHESLLAFFQ